MNNINKNRNTIITAIEVSKYSKVPMLFMANPGYGKTTVINMYGKKNGYHVESLIGSAFDRSEVLGYMVNNGGDHLRIMEPEWFSNIMEKSKQGIPSILFIDELSTAPSDVQGSLYRLIFEREIGNRKKLPDDCIILSAANYKGNLPSYFDITAPALNRFCIINLCPQNHSEMIDEFLQEEDDRFKDWPEFNYKPLSNDAKENVLSGIKNFMAEIFDNYSLSKDSSKGVLDITNTTLSDVYENSLTPHGEVYNFISARTISYLHSCIKTVIELGINEESNFFYKMIDGLIGLGTNSFNEEITLLNYRKLIHKNLKVLVKKAIAGTNIKVDKKDLFGKETSLSKRAQKLSFFLDSINFDIKSFSLHFKIIAEQVANEYPKSVHENLTNLFGKSVNEEKRKENDDKLLSDVSGLRNLVSQMEKLANMSKELQTDYEYVNSFVLHYSFYVDFSM